MIMTSFLPDSSQTFVMLAALFLAELIGGLNLQRWEPGPGIRAAAWGTMILATTTAHFITVSSPAGFRMMALITALFFGMKMVVAVSSRAIGIPSLSFSRWFAFAVGWPGMRPKIFTAALYPRNGWKNLALKGSLCALAGTILMLAAGPVWYWDHSVFLVIVLFFTGSSLLVHYGTFTLAAAFWRKAGFDCDALFKNPFPSLSLGEFWSQRWNLAFSEMTAVAVYHPLKGKLGPNQALLLSFTLSGLLHEVAISLPVKAGFGLPLAYFLLHYGLVGFERFIAAKGIVFRGVWARLWVYFWLIAPLPILFHHPFLKGIIWPLIGVAL